MKIFEKAKKEKKDAYKVMMFELESLGLDLP